jgi:alpha 1,2-mannosyltransferase
VARLQNLTQSLLSDVNGVIDSMKQLEDRFNKKFQYPYVFLNEEPFSDEFKTYLFMPFFEATHMLTWVHRRISELTDVQVQFGLIPQDHWHQPASIDEARAAAAREAMTKDKVIYGGRFLSCAD